MSIVCSDLYQLRAITAGEELTVVEGVETLVKCRPNVGRNVLQDIEELADEGAKVQVALLNTDTLGHGGVGSILYVADDALK